MRAAAVFAVLAACSGLDEPAPADLAQRVERVRERMHQRYAASDGARDAIVTNDLARATAAAQAIAAFDEPDVLPAWRPAFAEVRTAAAQLAAARDPAAAARALASLGERCASCHAAARATITLADPPPLAADGRLATQMLAHQLAAKRMWDGLVTGTDAAWLGGAEALQRARLTIVAEGEVPGHELGIADAIARVRTLAHHAAAASTPHARAEVYADLLATCVTCHHAIRDR